MAYQVFIRFNDTRDIVLDVASSSEEFDKTTVKIVKEKFKSVESKTPDIERIRVLFGIEQLDDDKSLGFYKVTHGSVLVFVMRTDGGKRDDKGLPRSESMERIDVKM